VKEAAGGQSRAVVIRDSADLFQVLDGWLREHPDDL